MKRKLLVTIDAGEKTCGKCECCEESWHDCSLFYINGGNTYLKKTADGDRLRCRACLAAERAAKARVRR
jgi:hypothetical protein